MPRRAQAPSSDVRELVGLWGRSVEPSKPSKRLEWHLDSGGLWFYAYDEENRFWARRVPQGLAPTSQ